MAAKNSASQQQKFNFNKMSVSNVEIDPAAVMNSIIPEQL